MDISTNAEKVIAQANEWTFAGDCSLLLWMKEIGMNLDQKATATIQNFDMLSSKLKNTSTALDNVTNSLAALQYTQFVENRCQDDDETLSNMADVHRDCVTEQQKDTSVVWQTFLKTNLDVLRNCHERYAIDFQDSDEEDTANNFIYQPKNPYNERLLPHIYGSKLWKEHWHVGLCDDSNSNSGDEASEAFSESSSSLSENIESLESNATNLSEWASTASIINDKDQLQQHLIKKQNASSLGGSQPLFPSSQEYINKPISSESSSSIASASISNSFAQNEQRFDLFAHVRNSPPATSTASSLVSLQQQLPQLHSATHKSNISGRDTDIKTQIPRRPVNLFDDDDFNSFLSEIVEGGNNSTDTCSNKTSVETEKLKTKKTLNLLDSQSKSPVGANQPTAHAITIASQTSNKLASLNLFGSRSTSPSNHLFTSVKEVGVSKSEQPAHAIISSKILFDEDDDDDFLNVFASRKTKQISKPRNQLFDDDFEEDNLSKFVENYQEKILGDEKKNEAGRSGIKENTSNQSLVDECDIFAANTKQGKNIGQQDKTGLSQKSNINCLLAKSKQINLFDDTADNSAEDDLFNNMKKEQSTRKFTDIPNADKGITISKQNSQLLNVLVDTNSLEDPINKNCIEAASHNILDTSKRGVSRVAQNEADKKIGDIIRINIDKNLANNKIFLHDKAEEKVKIAEDQKKAIPDQLGNNATKLINNLCTTSTTEKVKNSFSNLFIEEPPIDDDHGAAFFQNIGNNTMTEPYLTEHSLSEDCCEPALHNLPTVESNITKLLAHSSYTNLGLFSEVPPDDDDLEDSSIEQSNNSSNEPKRIHSVFYDDFNETMDAVNKSKYAENATNLHAIFYDEPPPDDDASVFQALSKGSQKIQLNDNEDHGQQTSAKSYHDKLSIADSTSVIEKPDADIKAIQSTKSDGISKLKMPELKIDIKTLLPPDANSMSKSFVQKSVKDISPSSTSSFNENILINVCKNRVRASAKRRPSTRRGRQENYRKSLVAKQEEEALIEQQIEDKATSSQDNQNKLPEIPKSKVKMGEKDNKINSDKSYGVYRTPSNSLDHKTKHNTDFSKEVVTQNNPLKSSINKYIAPNVVLNNLSTTRGLFDDEENDKFLFSNEPNKPNSLETNRLNEGSRADASILTETYAIDYTNCNIENKNSTSLKIDVSLKKPESTNSSRETQLSAKENEVLQDRTVVTTEANKELENEIKMLRTSAVLFDDVDIETWNASIKSFEHCEEVLNISKDLNNKDFDKDVVDDTDNDFLFRASEEHKPQGGDKKQQFSNVTDVKNEITNEKKIFKYNSSKFNSLFGSDDENGSNDDVPFLNTKQTTLTKASGKVDSQTLFSDIDDDDDNLFCSKAAPSRTSNNKVIAKLKHEPRKNAETSKITTTDNPLSDLLGN